MSFLKKLVTIGVGVYFVGCSPQGQQEGSTSLASRASFSVGSNVCSFHGQVLLDGESITAFLFKEDPDGACHSEVRVCNDGVLSGSYFYSSCNDLQTSCRFNGSVIPDGGSVVAYANPSGQTCESEERVCTKGVLSGSYIYSECAENLPRSCVFDGQTIVHGEQVTAYQNSSVAYGESCVSESRACDDGSLSGSFGYSSCQVGAPGACLFNGQTIAHGESVTAFLDTSVSFGESCTSQERVCENGELSGSYQNSSCEEAVPKTCNFNDQTISHGMTVSAYQNSSVEYGDTCVKEVRTCMNGELSGSYNFGSCQVGAPKTCSFGGRNIAHGEVVTAYQNFSVSFGEECESEKRVCDNGSLSGSYNYSSCEMDAPKSCSFNGKTIVHGESVTAFMNSSVGYGESCMSEGRTCNNGNLSGSYQYGSCEVGAPNSCLFNGRTIAHGESVNAFLDSSVPYGSSCSSEQRVCDNGILSGEYNYPSCNVGMPKSCLFNGQTIAHGQSIDAFKFAQVPHGSSCDSEGRTCNNGNLSGSYQYGSCEIAEKDPEDEIIDDVISENESCAEIFNGDRAKAADLEGDDFISNGNHSEVSIKDVGRVIINGRSSMISIDRATSVNLNGSHAAVCVKAKRVENINGSCGASGVPIVLIGEDSNSSVGNLNGARKSDIVLVNMKSANTINGTSKDIYVSGGHIRIINGNGGNLYLTHGTTVDRVNGSFNTIYVYPGSTLKQINGRAKIVRP